jgi:hypothetical protein
LRFHRGIAYSGYFDYTPDQIDAVLSSFRTIKALAGERRVTIGIIPRPNDFARVRASGTNPLFQVMSKFGREADIQVLDLLQLMPQLEPRIEPTTALLNDMKLP